MRGLNEPARSRPQPHSCRPRVERPEVQIVVVLIRFPAVEHGSLQREDAVVDTTEDDVRRHVRGIEDVMCERGHRIFRARRPVHEGHGAKSRLADQGARNGHAAARTERNAERRRELHEEIVWVLVIGDLETLVGLTNLKDLGEPEAGCCQRFRRDHAGEAKQSRPQPSTRSSHEPVLRAKLRVAAMAALPVERSEYDGIPGTGPARVRRWIGCVSRMLIGSICLGRLIGCRLLPAVDRSCAGEQQGEKNGANPCHASVR